MNEATRESIAGRIRTARSERGMSQRELGERLGVASQQVQKYETAKNEVTASRLVQIARAVNLPLSFFFEDIGRPSGRPLAKNTLGRVRLLRTYDTLDGPNRALLISIATSLAETARQKPIAV
jgi:transcriptional regulator with XRE-family HTH domain